MVTKNLTNVLDALVRELKTHVELCGVRFVHAGKVSAAENPLSSFLAACEVKSFSKDMEACRLKGKLLLTLCAPAGCGKRQLCELSLLLCSFIEESDLQEIITSIACMDATFDEGRGLWRQGIAVEVEAFDASSAGAEIAGFSALPLEKAEEISKPEIYRIRELLSGVVGCESKRGENILKLTAFGECELPDDAFLLKIPVCGFVYEACRVVKLQRNLLSGRTEIELCFESKSVLEED